MVTLTADDVRAALATVMDPEIPTCSIVDLGIVERITVGEGIEIDLLPTFAGCPALDAIRADVETAARALAPGATVRVTYLMSPPWTTDRITEQGEAALKEYGIAPPHSGPLLQIGRARADACPYCGSERTEQQSAFGPTPCRAVRYCPACRNPYESFKQKA